jgi:GAF domain-containing protein
VGDTCLGVISVQSTHTEGLYDADDERLLSTIAANVGVALQNVRLFNETQEALGHQTATADILRVISRSPTDVQPVFDAIVTTAVRLLACDFTGVLRCEGSTYSTVAVATPSGRPAGPVPTRIPIDPSANFPSRVIVDKKMLHIPDWSTVELSEQDRRASELFRVKSSLMLPLLREDECLGVLIFTRSSASAFSDKEIALAESFRDQAVIAIENVRLFNETKVALERQTATADILRVISNSPTDVQPVLNAVAQRAGFLCRADLSRVWLLGDGQLHAMTGYGGMYTANAHADVLSLRRTSIAGRAILERRTIHVEDVLAVIDTEYPDVREIQKRIGLRTALNVPLLREGEALGVISLGRGEVRPFDAAEIALVETFAGTGGDRDPERADVQRDQGRPRGRGSSQRGEELVPRDDEPRDPHADECGDRHERPPARHQARPEQHDYVATIRESGDALLTIINDISTSRRSRRADGHRGAAFRPSRLRRIGARSRQRAAQRRSTSTSRTCSRATFRPAIRGDVTRLRQIMLNLLSNAVKFTEPGEVVLTVTRSAPSRRGRAHVRRARHRHRSVRGRHEPPVPVVLAGRLVDDAQVRRHGLGLAISKRLRELMGGHMWGESDGLGKGRRSTSPIKVPVAELPPARSRDFVGVQPELAGKRVLVVDDNATNRRVLALQTASGGCSREHESPQEALRWLERRRVRPRDPRHAHAGNGRRRARAPIRSAAQAAARAFQLARPARGGRRRQLFDAYLVETDPAVATLRHAGRLLVADARRRRAPRQSRRSIRRWPRGIRCASFWPRTTSSTRSSRCASCSRWAIAPTSRRTASRRRVGRAADYDVI